MRTDKPTSIRFPDELKSELQAAANEEAIPFHAKVIAVLNDWLTQRLRSKRKPEEGILK